MLIQEEYARRHSLPMTLASYTLNEGLAFLRATGPNRLIGNVTHMMMTARWVPHDRHPGTYQMFFQKPAHDSYSSRSNFSIIQEPSVVTYEDFEGWLRCIRPVSLPNFEAVVDEKAMSLFSWEMFVCCYDGWIVRNGTTKLLSHVEASIDPVLSIDSRYNHYEAAIDRISGESPSLAEKWEMNFVDQRKKVVPWLGKLFNGD